MPEIAATLEKDAISNGPPAGEDNPRRPRADTMKFIHASGTRPLDGYTIKRGIGAGGFGEVYFAISDAGKEVALKRIQRNLDVEIRGVSQCLNLKHVNLVSLYDIKYDDHGDAWVIMEYVSGGSLRDALEKSPQGMLPADVQRWFSGIAAGVAYLHDHGIVHRDLKPGNIFSDEGVVKIGDYGLSKFISCSRRSGHTESVGTFHYMAPEIGRGSYGKEIDVYALGIILYEMVTGHVPFDGETSQEIIMKHLTASPDLSLIPLQYRDVVRRALLKDPARRYSEVAEMLAAFAGSPIGSTAKPDTADLQTPTDSIPFAEVVNASAEVSGNENAPPYKNNAWSAELVREEPVAAFLRKSWQNFNSFWRTVEAPSRAVLAIVFCVIVIMNSAWLLPLTVALGSMYLVYFGIYSIVTVMSTPAPAPRVEPTFVASPPPANPYPISAPLPVPEQRREKWHGKKDRREILKHRSLTEQLGELVGGMLMSTFVVGVVGLIMLMIGGRPLELSLDAVTFYAWFSLTIIIGAWSVLALAKLWEKESGDEMRRRFVMLVVGLAVGAASYGLSQYLFVNVSDSLAARPLRSMGSLAHLYDSMGRPALAAYLMYFGAMFASIRWWLMADPLRYARLNVWDTCVCGGVAWLIQIFWSFWQPWGIMMFVTMALAVQMSSRWISTTERRGK